MSDDATSDLLLPGALFLGAGVVGFYGARWWRGSRAPAAIAAPAAPPAAFAALPPPAAPREPVPRKPAAPIKPPPASAPARPTTPRPASGGPVTSPDQLPDETAPVSSPAQVAAPAAPTATTAGALPRTFDPIFDRYRGDLPIEYLRALAMQESGMNPRASSGPARGLLQITEIVRGDFNRAHRTAITRAQLLDPAPNVRIATWLLRFLVDGFRTHHANVANLRTDWSNPRFVELVTFAWNAGGSEAGGVGRVVSYLEKKGAREIDLDLVHTHARDAGASAQLSNPAKVRWSRTVAALYQRERALAARSTTAAVA